MNDTEQEEVLTPEQFADWSRRVIARSEAHFNSPQKHVARAWNISEQYLSDLLRGRRLPGDALLQRLGFKKVTYYVRDFGSFRIDTRPQWIQERTQHAFLGLIEVLNIIAFDDTATGVAHTRESARTLARDRLADLLLYLKEHEPDLFARQPAKRAWRNLHTRGCIEAKPNGK